MPKNSMTREEVIAAIQECAAQIGHVPSFPELRRSTRIRRRAINASFGTYVGALQACGLERRGPGYQVSLESLFLDWAGLTRRLGRIPSMNDYGVGGRYSVRPLLRCYRGWRNIPAGMMEYAKKAGQDVEWSDVLDIIAQHFVPRTSRGWTSSAEMGTHPKSKMLTNQPVYGPPLTHPALSHAPTNEQGVIFLFGTVAQQLGFKVMRLQTTFPDCEAMREVEPERWQWVRIEFEYESRNFLAHMHPAKDCDLIVCWSHNWKECPLEVLELKTVVGNLYRG
jgi:hypothetical protein